MKPATKKVLHKDTLGLIIVLIPIVALLSLIYIRIGFVDGIFGKAVTCSGCFNLTVFLNDLPYLLFLIFVLLLGFTLKSILLSRFFRLIGIASLAIYVGDILTSKELSSRLLFSDAVVFLKQSSIIQEHLSNTEFINNNFIAAMFITAVIIIFFLAWPSLNLLSGRVGKFLIVTVLVGFITSLMIPTTQYVHNWALNNVITVNLNRGETITYSKKTIRKVLETESSKPATACTTGKNEHYDLIVLILESWSPYQSNLFSGLNNWTPRLDKIAKKNAYYTNLHASGFTTNEGLMGMLGGVELLSTGKTRTPFVTAWGYERTLPKLLKKNGYYTSFLTTGNLRFSHKNTWLEHIGFDNIEGHNHPFYDGMKRLHFGAAPDEALYQRTLQHLDEIEITDNNAERAPYLVVVENVSSHHPYVHPHTGERDSEAVFRYMDDTAADLYEQLETRGFFEHGRLLVISDHRAMMPVTKGEQNLLKRAVLSKIPAFFVGPSVPQGPIDIAFHQTDLLATMERSVASELCSENGIRDMLAPAETVPRCLYHGRGDSRELVNVFCPDGEGTIKLAGDKTKMYQAKGLSKERKKEVIETLNHYRILRDIRQQEWNTNNPRD